MALKRHISTIGLLFASISGIIGSGWLFGPYYASQLAGPASIFSWIIGGCLMMVIALTFAELSTMFPVSGGLAFFSQISHGTLVSFTFSLCAWISLVVFAPIETMALIQYASNYLPALATKIGGVHELTTIGIVVSGIIMLIMSFINILGVRFLSRLNNYIAILKLGIPTITVIVLLVSDYHFGNFTQFGFLPAGIKGVLTALPLGGIVFSFLGYNTAVQLAGETKNPSRAIPFAIIVSLLLCIVLYVAVQVAFIGALTPESLKNGWQNLSFRGDNGPIAGVVAHIGITWLLLLLYFSAIVAPFGSGLIYTSTSARMNYAMSKNEYFPKFLQILNKKKIPILAILINFVIGMLLFLPFPGWQGMVTFLVSAFIMSYAVGPIALVALRKSLPNHKRTFKVPFATFTCFIAYYICNLLVYWTGWNVIWKVLVFILVGVISLIISKKFFQKNTLLHTKNALWLILHFLGIGVASYLGSFGGGKSIIPFGWDFLCIAIFSLIVFFISEKSAFKKALKIKA